jgi:hypothetical protein
MTACISASTTGAALGFGASASCVNDGRLNQRARSSYVVGFKSCLTFGSSSSSSGTMT